ncbi:hypothetical protein PRUPE_6G178700 [Prunus persica]|uniref:Uncharacterized protein n=1 Tax=Prunus persica TaxID=3760 RepID=A0A251NTT8_PRUPE|nr:hypothetical protein PRUPE_6G178700 [Prunus persica]
MCLPLPLSLKPLALALLDTSYSQLSLALKAHWSPKPLIWAGTSPICIICTSSLNRQVESFLQLLPHLANHPH